MADCYMTLGFLQQTGTPAEFEVRQSVIMYLEVLGC